MSEFPALPQSSPEEREALLADLKGLMVDWLLLDRPGQTITGGKVTSSLTSLGPFKGKVMDGGGSLLGTELGRLAPGEAEILVEESSALAPNDELTSERTGQRFRVLHVEKVLDLDGTPLCRRAFAAIRSA